MYSLELANTFATWASPRWTSASMMGESAWAARVCSSD